MLRSHYFTSDGVEVKPPLKYKAIFDRVATQDDWMFQQFPGIVFMRRYVTGEFWPYTSFDIPDKDIWVEVVRTWGGLSARHPMGITRGFFDSICRQNN